MNYKSTGQVADELGTNEPRIQALIRRKKLPPPARIGSQRAWTPEDIERLRAVLVRNA